MTSWLVLREERNRRRKLRTLKKLKVLPRQLSDLSPHPLADRRLQVRLHHNHLRDRSHLRQELLQHLNNLLRPSQRQRLGLSLLP